MKKILLFLLLIIFISCSDDESNGELIIGKWSCTHVECDNGYCNKWIFSKDKNYKITYEENDIYIAGEGIYSIIGDTLILKDKNGDIMKNLIKSINKKEMLILFWSDESLDPVLFLRDKK